MAQFVAQTQLRRDPRDQFASLPGPLQAFLSSKACFEDLLALYKKHAITGPTLDAVVDLIGDIDFGYRPFSDFLSALTEEIKIPPARAKTFALEVAGLHFLPIADLIAADVWNAIKTWGGDPTTFPVKKIETTKTTAAALINELTGKLQVALTPRIQERLRYVLLSRIQGIRNDVETKEMLTRDEKVGGAALPPSIAEELLDQLRRKLATAQIVAEMPQEINHKSQITNYKSEIDAKPLPPKPVAKTVAPPISPKPRPTLSEALPAAQKFAGPSFEIPQEKPQKDEEEIATMREQLAERIPKENNTAARGRTASVESIVRASGTTFTDVAHTERLKRIIEARLRDIRDAFETKRLLAQSIQTGGLMLTAEAADRLTNLIEAEYLAITGQGAAEKKREANALTTTTQQAAKARRAALTASLDKASEDRFHKIAEKSKHLQEREVLLPQATSSHVAAPLVVSQTIAATKTQSPPRPIFKPVLSPASVIPRAGNKPKMEDVKVVRTVSGPIDELAVMTVVEFRRLSKDPREATLKIRDKIELLKEEGFERYLAAVRAWQSSEPNRTYLALTRAALSQSTSVPMIIQQKISAKEPTLTIDEFQAILTLNSQLQF